MISIWPRLISGQVNRGVSRYIVYSYDVTSHNSSSHDTKSHNTSSQNTFTHNTPPSEHTLLSHQFMTHPLITPLLSPTTLSVHPGAFPCFSLLSMQWFCTGVLNKLGRLSTHQILDCADELGAAVNLLQFMVLRILACINDTPSDGSPSDGSPSDETPSDGSPSDETPSGPTSVLRSFLGLPTTTSSSSSSSSSTATSKTLAVQIHNRIHDVFETLGELIGMSNPFN